MRTRCLSPTTVSQVSSTPEPTTTRARRSVVEIANQRKVGYLVWNVEANKTYMLFGNNWQFGFQGYEFTTGTTGISEVSTTATVAANAPIYNLAGQKRNEVV